MPNKSVFGRIFNFVAGPWPIHPIGFAVIAGFLNQFSGVRLAVSHGESTAEAWIQFLPSSIAMAAFLWAGFALTSFLIKRAPSLRQKQATFLGINFLISGIFAVLFGIYDGRSITDAPLNTLRMYLVILTVSIIFGISENRIRRQATRAENALEEVDRQRSLLLQADENTRREVADFLHDRVQAGLVVTNMQLGNISEKLSDQHKAELKSVIEELEEIRRFDIRDASRLLSPDIAVVGLERSLLELVQRYSSTMKVTVELGMMPELLPQHSELAIYRICEQALLNALIHGKATKASISLRWPSENEASISVSNNGRPISESENVSGAGSAVIDAWVSNFDGSWSLTNRQDDAVELSAHLKL